MPDDWVKPQYEGTGTSRRNVNRVFDQLMKVEKRWDLVIIDEAHYASTDSNRADFAKAIQERGDSLLLLTATPHSGDPEHFFNLLNLIDPFMFADPTDLDRPDARQRVDKVMIRRGKETISELNGDGELVKKFRDRDPHPMEIEFSKAEKALYDAVSMYTAEGWAQLSRKRKITESERNIGKFLLTLVQKRMVSSLTALRETLERRIDSIVESRTLSRIDGRDSRDISRLLKDYNRGEFMEDEDKEFVERYLETRRIQAMYAERTNEVTTLRGFLEATDKLINAEQDSKLAWLTDFLKQLFTRDPNEKVIIFTEYRDTLNYLKSKLEREWFLGSNSIVVIHGGMPLGEDENQEPDFLAFGHPLLERMVHYCRVIRATELGGKLTCTVTDYAGLPGVIFNFLLRFEDRVGHVIREELEPTFVDQESVVQPKLGRQLFLSPTLPQSEPHRETLERIRQRITDLKHTAERYIRAQYQAYYQRVEIKRNEEINILIDDLERFDRGAMEHLQHAGAAAGNRGYACRCVSCAPIAHHGDRNASVRGEGHEHPCAETDSKATTETGNPGVCDVQPLVYRLEQYHLVSGTGRDW